MDHYSKPMNQMGRQNKNTALIITWHNSIESVLWNSVRVLLCSVK